jgi:hypothetical protein
MSQLLSRRIFLALTGSAAVAPALFWAADHREVPPLLDHILLGCNDLASGIALVEQKTGVRAAFGGVHPGRGTQNALLSLGERRYLEIIAPDPEQSGVQWFSEIKELRAPKLLGWAQHTDDLESLAKKFQEVGVSAEQPRAGSRKRPDGQVLNWKTMNLADSRSGLLPFFIEWNKSSVHPSRDSPAGCRLDHFGLVSSDSGKWQKLFSALGIDLSVEPGEKTHLVARITGPKGTLEVTS